MDGSTEQNQTLFFKHDLEFNRVFIIVTRTTKVLKPQQKHHLNPNHSVSVSLTKWLLSLNITTPYSECCHIIKVLFNSLERHSQKISCRSENTCHFKEKKYFLSFNLKDFLFIMIALKKRGVKKNVCFPNNKTFAMLHPPKAAIA